MSEDEQAAYRRAFRKLTVSDMDVAEAMPQELRAKALNLARRVTEASRDRRPHGGLLRDRQLRLLEDPLRSRIVENHRGCPSLHDARRPGGRKRRSGRRQETVRIGLG